MAKAVVTLTDEEDGTLHVEVEFEPDLSREEFEAGNVTEAQAVALLLLQDLMTDELGRTSGEQIEALSAQEQEETK